MGWSDQALGEKGQGAALHSRAYDGVGKVFWYEMDDMQRWQLRGVYFREF